MSLKSSLVYSVASAALLVFSSPMSFGQVTEFETDDAGLYASPMTFSLDAGVLSFQEAESVGGAVDQIDQDNRLAGGIRLNWNFTGDSALYVGLGSGLYYSRLEGIQNIGEGEGSNFGMVPLNLQLGTSIADNFLISAHAGANGVYRSRSGSVDLGRANEPGSASWEAFPAVGANLGIGFGGDVGLSFRGDYTFTPADDLLMATVGLTFGMG